MSGLTVGVVGASGYIGAELVRILSLHPEVNIALLVGDTKAGQTYSEVYPHLVGLSLPDIVSSKDLDWGKWNLDIVFCALPHGSSHSIIKDILQMFQRDDGQANANRPKVIDLSADFRLESLTSYQKWYGRRHDAPSLQQEAVYGLTEQKRDEIRKSRLTSCPGCYPTALLLPIVPLLKAGAIESSNIIYDAKSGVTGAGRTAKQQNLFSELSDGVHAYGISEHRHAPEMEQELGKAANCEVVVTFTPHLLPMNRGILGTIYVNLKQGNSSDHLRGILKETYKNEIFITVLNAGEIPATRHVRGSNHCLIAVFPDRRTGGAIIISVIDNLLKGGAGQAIQNMNVMSGYNEMTGLEQRALFP